MSSPHPQYIEQDNVVFSGPNELPSYDELAVHNGPNSRFGRWRGWIEKRAAERYADLSPDDLRRRRARGWDIEQKPLPQPELPAKDAATEEFLDTTPTSLHIQTSNLNIRDNPTPQLTPTLQPLPFTSQKLSNTHLRLSQFGSRFLPHATSRIRCLLPLMSDSLLLIGHDEGLSVLDMFPRELSETGRLVRKGPQEAQAKQIWTGEVVYQMTILEMEGVGADIPQGVVLALVGPEPETCKDAESRSLRMYNLASLVSLAKWALSSKGTVLNLHPKPAGNGSTQQSPSKKHRHQSSIARSLKSLIEPPSPTYPSDPSQPYQKLLSPISIASPGVSSRRPPSPNVSATRRSSNESSWEFIDSDNLPLCWANDYVPLTSPGSRLLNATVLSYALWSDENRRGRGGQLLAVATKTNILLYETPKGERAFHFVKEFYTPLPPRSVTFFQQNVQDVGRGNSHRRTDSSATVRSGNGNQRISQVPSVLQDYGTHLSLFVIFDKKAGWIRIADSAVGEMELFDESSLQPSSHGSSYPYPLSPRDSAMPSASSSLGRRSRLSFEYHHGSGKWIPISRCEFPPETGVPPALSKVHMVTRGKQTQIVPCPLPATYASCMPLWIIHWQAPPSYVMARAVCCPTHEDDPQPPPSPSILQIMAFGEGGVEVEEVPISLLFQRKGKGKAPQTQGETAAAPTRAYVDLGVDAGFLSAGGHWDTFEGKYTRDWLTRSSSTSSDVSASSESSIESEERAFRLKKQEGVYGWYCKGLQDWHIFWLGGSLEPFDADDEESQESLYG